MATVVAFYLLPSLLQSQPTLYTFLVSYDSHQGPVSLGSVGPDLLTLLSTLVSQRTDTVALAICLSTDGH